jgi:hypothetical protein
MKWTLVVMALGTTPIPTNLVYETLEACYAAEERMAADYARYHNEWLAKNPARPVPTFITPRLARGVCVPHFGPSNSD